MSCHILDNPTEQINEYCNGDITNFGVQLYMQELAYNNGDSALTFAYYGRNGSGYLAGLYRYSFLDSSFDSLFTFKNRFGPFITGITFLTDDEMLFEYSTDIWLYNFTTDSLIRLTVGAQAKFPKPVINTDWITYLQTSGTEAGLWKYNLATGELSHLKNYVIWASWSEKYNAIVCAIPVSGDNGKFLITVDLEGNVIDTLISYKNMYNRIIPNSTNDEGEILFQTIKPAKGYQVEILPKDRLIPLDSGSFPIWDSQNERIIYYNSNPGKYGIWQMDYDGCNKTELINYYDFETYLTALGER